jgi:hypothetical protein
MNDYRPEIKSLLNTLKRHKFSPYLLNDGEELIRGSAITAEEICAVDESHLYVKDSTDKKFFVRIILGNEPGEAVADYSDYDPLDDVIQEHYNRWENKKQPKM